MPVKLNSSGGGSVTLTTPSTATDYTATFPANTGNVVTTGSSGVVTQAMLSTNVAGNGPIFSASLSAAQTITNNTWTQVQFNGTQFDTSSAFNVSTYRYAVPVNGYYFLSAQAYLLGTLTYATIRIYNNAASTILVYGNQASAAGAVNASGFAYLTTSSTIELQAYITGAGTLQVAASSGSPGQTFLQAALIRSA